MLRIGNNKIIKIYQDTEVKKLYLGNTIKYWNIRDKGIMPYYPIYDWEEYQYHKQSWWVDLNDQWELATVRQDSDTNYETYQSFSNYNVPNGWARMKVNIDSGVDSFTIHYGSYAEQSYDYTLIGHLDMDMSTSTSTSTGTTPSTNTWAKTSINSQSASAPNISYTYNISDASTQHFIWIAYRKDSSVNNNDDRGYVSFDKTLNINIDGWKKTIYTYTVQDNGDYDYTFYLATQDVISEDKETIIVRTPITSTTEELRTQFIDGAEDDTFIVNRQIWAKRYYQIWINEWITTDYYTYGEWKGEIQELPIEDFMFNYNFMDYVEETHTVPNEAKANWHQDLTLTGTPIVENGVISVTNSNAYAQFPFSSNAANPFNNNSNSPYLTTIIKVGNIGNEDSDIISNRGYYATGGSDGYNWMLRGKGNNYKLHDSSGEKAALSFTPPSILVSKVNNTSLTNLNITNNTSSTATISYSKQSGRICFFCCNFNNTSTTTINTRFTGEVYWMFCAKRLLTDEEIQEVINYNESKY